MSGGDSGAHEGLKIGRALESARKARGLSLKEAEEETKIRAGYLAELELENFDVLPAVYVQGFLRTYANFLQLDGEAMVQELKRRQGTREEPPLYVGPEEDDSLDDILAALGGVGTKEQDTTGDEEDERSPLLPVALAGYVYLGLAVVLVLAVAVLALTLAGDGRPSAVSQVREPLISQAPETSPPDMEENAGTKQPEQEEEQRAEKGDPERPAGPEAAKEDDEKTEQASWTGQDRDDIRPVQDTASATASAAPERDAEERASAEPPRRNSAPARQISAAPQPSPRPAPQPSPRPAGQPGGAPSGGNSSPPPRNDGQIEVRVAVGAKDPVRLTGGPFDD
jgi:cytoskeletal protein RodZ